MLAALAGLILAFQEPQLPTAPVSLGELKTNSEDPIQIPDPKHKATVLIFMTVDCPIANRYAPEIKRLDHDFRPKGVEFVRVYVDPTVEPTRVHQHTKEFNFASPAVIDSDHRVVKAVGAKVTPQAVVLDPQSRMRYRGRIDDRYVEHGRLRRDTSYRRDLREALNELLAGKTITVNQTPALGCAIPETPGR